MARRGRDYKPIEFRQLCMVVKAIIMQAPSINDAEWKAQIQDRLAALGFEELDPEKISRAMTQVEHAVKQTIGARPVEPPPDLSEVPKGWTPKPDLPKESRTNQPQGWDTVVAEMRRLRKVSPVLSGTSRRPSPRREVLGITEEVALDVFWRQVNRDADKLVLLRAYAEVAILRPGSWDFNAVRAHFNTLRFSQEPCFVCHFEHTHRHHIIQIQHGGTSYARNMVPLCEACHQTVHPWLSDGVPGRRRSIGGWTRIGEPSLVARAIEQEIGRKDPA